MGQASQSPARLGQILNPCRDDALRIELVAMQQKDLALRAELARSGELFNGYAEAMATLHRRHNARLRSILAEHGWLQTSQIGDDGATALWLLVQHAILDPPLMRQAHRLLTQAVGSGNAQPSWLASLTDRILTLEGRAQRYGTQHDWDANGLLSPLPIAEPAQVDARRRAVGLEPLASVTTRLRDQAAREGDKPPADFSRRQQEARDWAISIGWRAELGRPDPGGLDCRF